MITVHKDNQTNKVRIYKDGQRVYISSISGNIAELESGELVII
jgi:hypothetical protein